MIITSTAFASGEYIPAKYTCDGENINPPLTFSKVPKNAQSLALIVEDPDAPSGIFTHWVLYNIPPATIQILENEAPRGSALGMTDFGKTEYGGPCPPASPQAHRGESSGTHRYFFKLFALDTMLNLPPRALKKDVEEAMKNHILESATLIGLYKRGGG